MQNSCDLCCEASFFLPPDEFTARSFSCALPKRPPPTRHKAHVMRLFGRAVNVRLAGLFSKLAEINFSLCWNFVFVGPGAVRRWRAAKALKAFVKFIQMPRSQVIESTFLRDSSGFRCRSLSKIADKGGRRNWFPKAAFLSSQTWLEGRLEMAPSNTLICDLIRSAPLVSQKVFIWSRMKCCYCCCGSKLLMRSTWKWNLCFAIKKKLRCRLPPMNISIIAEP